MTKFLTTLITVAVVCALAAGVACAGQNAGASARLYWMAGTAATSTSLGTVRNSTANTAIAEVTIKGSLGFKGEDIQLLINNLDGSGLPPAWQAFTDGPADGNYTCPAVTGKYTYASTTYPDVFFASPACTGVLVAQTASSIVYNNTINPCLAPHNTGLIWLQAAAGVGQVRTATTEYGAICFKIVLNAGVTGDNTDPNGPMGVCIAANWRQPCHDTTPGSTSSIMQTVDTAGKGDFFAYESGYDFLTWHGELIPGSPPTPCPAVTPVKGTTWGQLKRLYH
ncbi:MAG TPA: hypothetical protein VMS93_06865 [Candidatus Saccharimonadales bacterium]|nr:hypothetical protein [Candidatus Saccharimonadales bacterium]